MARGEGGIGIGMLVSCGVGILALAIVFMLGPVIGGQMEAAMPALGATSNWNSSYNTDLKTGADVWEDLTPFLIIVGLVIMAAIILYVIRGVA
jgi:hypothetical protein